MNFSYWKTFYVVWVYIFSQTMFHSINVYNIYTHRLSTRTHTHRIEKGIELFYFPFNQNITAWWHGLAIYVIRVGFERHTQCEIYFLFTCLLSHNFFFNIIIVRAGFPLFHYIAFGFLARWISALSVFIYKQRMYTNLYKSWQRTIL